MTLQDSLRARLDRLPTARNVAQFGATLGRDFSYEVLQAVAELDEPLLREGLSKLVEAEVLYQSGLPPRARYIFKHALIQDSAYQSLLKSTRQQYHGRIAQVLSARFAEVAETQPELLAHHYTQARLFKEAIPYWQRAGERAAARSATAEATSHINRGLELLAGMPDSSERAQQELALLLILGPVLIASRGWSAAETETVYKRAAELCQKIGNTPQLFPVLYGVCTVYAVRPDLKEVRDLAMQLIARARQQRNADALVEGYS